MSQHRPGKRLSSSDIQRMKGKQRIAVLTAYDALTAKLLDRAGIDVLLVGDSLGMVLQGRADTLGVTLDHMVYHARMVNQGAARAHVVVDLPFMSYQVSVEEGLRAAGRLVTEGRASAVKLEGGRRNAALIARLTEIGIPVMGHLGLTPQSVRRMGYRLQARDEAAADVLIEEAKLLEASGAYALVLEGIPRAVARQATQAVGIPTIGIGAGPDCDGQVLVVTDMLGLDPDFQPSFVKRFDTLGERVVDAAKRYIEEVRAQTFPADTHFK